MIAPSKAAVEAARADRFTTVHCRYHVIGLIGGEGELAETAQSFVAAVRIGRAYLGPRGFERVEVFDSMAHAGRVDHWCVNADGTVSTLSIRSRAQETKGTT